MKRGTNGFEPERLVQVLAARRLSQVQLATMVGVSPPTISKWRSGQQSPEPETLERLASVVNVSASWFARPVVGETTAPLFRSNASAHVAARSMLKARLEWVQEVANILEEFVDFPSVHLPERDFREPDQISYSDIEAAAQECRDVWRLGSGPIPDVALALENAGVVLAREETGVSQIEGLSAWSNLLARPLVLLAADKGNGFRSRFDAAHELGHLVLHRHISKTSEPERHKELERQAHQFAGAFLLPAQSFAAEVRMPVTLDNLLLLKQRWGVSVAAMIMRLEALEIIDASEKLTLFKRRSARWGVKAEPGDDAWPPEQPRLLKRTIELLITAGIVPREGIARHLGISDRDVESLCGLPSGYLDGVADVVDLAKLKGDKLRESSVRQFNEPTASILDFARQRKRV